MPFIKAEDHKWKQILNATFYDLYHLPGYLNLEAKRLHGEPIGWYNTQNDKQILIPLIKCKVKGHEGLYDLQSPYGYPGILTTSSLNNIEKANVINNYNSECSDTNCVTSFIRLNPFMNNWFIEEKPGVHFQLCGDIITIPLQSETLFSNNHSRNIRKLTDNGFSILEDGKCYITQFADAYTNLMMRLKAKQYYCLDFQYFDKLININPENFFLIAVLSPEREFAAGGIFTLINGMMQFLYGTTNEKYHPLSPSKLMIKGAIELGKRKGAYALNLGGGYKADNQSGLYRFKKGFNKNGITLKYSCLHLIHKPALYSTLPQINSDYFPAYRVLHYAD